MQEDSIRPDTWPKTEEGAPEEAALLLDTPSGQELFNAQMTLTGLGVPFLLADRDKVTFTKVLFGTNINGGLVYVPISLLEDARTLLASGGDATEEDSEELPGDLQE